MARTRRIFFRAVQSLLKGSRGLGGQGNTVGAGLADSAARRQIAFGQNPPSLGEQGRMKKPLWALSTAKAWIWGLTIGIFLHACFASTAWLLSAAILPVAAQVPVAKSVIQGSPSPSQLMQQGIDLYKAGKFDDALRVWQQAALAYKQAGNNTGVTEALINQAQAMQELGLNRRACDTLLQAFGSADLECQKLSQEDSNHQRLKSLLKTLEEKPNSLTKVIGLRNLGEALQLVGDLEASQQVLQLSLALAQKLNSPEDISAALFSLGNTARAKQNKADALSLYQQAARESPSPITRLQAQLNQLSLLLETENLSREQALEQLSLAQKLWPQIFSEIENDKLPASREVVSARINLAQSLMKLRESLMKLSVLGPQSLVLNSQSLERLLQKAVEQAKALKDQRTIAYALGNLGTLYEKTGQLSKAKERTKQALLIAETINAPEISYRWQWQLARLQTGQRDRPGAIATYNQAVETLKSLRGDLVATNRDVQFSFKESVEPVYRQFVDLLLQPPQTPPSQGGEPSQEALKKAREVIESLQLAELDNFFREACIQSKQQLDTVVDKDAPNTAVIYPIIMPDRLEVILKLPQQKNLRHYFTRVPQSEVEKTLAQLRQNLVYPHSVEDAKSLSKQVHDWLLKPAKEHLAQNNITTLVFVLDGSLRNIPMAALYDGKSYLIENYSIALAPGLNLIDPKRLKRGQFKALTAGVSEARPEFKFGELPNVERELKQIQSEVPSQLLINAQFTSKAFQDQIKSLPVPVVHLATHGKFGSTADETYILAWDKLIKLNELNNLLRNRDESQPTAIELLVLSACQTAAGDNRAALGIAGVAVRAGARSTIASLWNVNDQSTAVLMSRFYQEFAKKGLTKAEALRQAQLVLLKDGKEPLYWSPYILVGNWL